MDLIEIHNMENSFYMCDTIITSKDDKYDFESIVFDNKYIIIDSNRLKLIFPDNSSKICMNPHKIRLISNTADDYYNYEIETINYNNIFDEVHWNLYDSEDNIQYTDIKITNLYLYTNLEYECNINLSKYTKKINITGYSKAKLNLNNPENIILNLTNFYCSNDKILNNLDKFYKVMMNNTTRIQYNYNNDNLFYKPSDTQLITSPIDLNISYTGKDKPIIHEFTNKFINLISCNLNNCFKFKNCVLNIYISNGLNKYEIKKRTNYGEILNGTETKSINKILCNLENCVVNIYHDKNDIIFIKDDKTIINDYNN